MNTNCEQKECLRCHKIKHVDEFPKCKRGTHGRASYCIPCFKEYQIEYNKRPGRKEKIRKATQKYRNNNRERWRALHRIHVYNKRVIIKAQSDGTVTDEFLKKLYATKNCYWCKKSTPIKKRTAEHIIPLSRGGMHSIHNLTMACVTCNSSKLNFKL